MELDFGAASSSSTTTDQRLRACSNWANALKAVASGQLPLVIGERGEEAGQILPPPRREVLVFVNPVSGSGAALRTWHETVAPFLASADITPRLVATTHAGHARATITEMNSSSLLQLWAVVVVGGDGLLYEVVQGLANHADQSLLKRVSLACVPGGSGNGFAKSVLFEAGEAFSAPNAAYLVVRVRR